MAVRPKPSWCRRRRQAGKSWGWRIGHGTPMRTKASRSRRRRDANIQGSAGRGGLTSSTCWRLRHREMSWCTRRRRWTNWSSCCTWSGRWCDSRTKSCRCRCARWRHSSATECSRSCRWCDTTAEATRACRCCRWSHSATASSWRGRRRHVSRRASRCGRWAYTCIEPSWCGRWLNASTKSSWCGWWTHTSETRWCGGGPQTCIEASWRRW
mmetsp:Transcript_135232/g.431771  ORF Transcript_135232/g.431771 Transcript_135232/m.431771 type:complete len:211 (+) Transcript_135232:927-1559(+)